MSTAVPPWMITAQVPTPSLVVDTDVASRNHRVAVGIANGSGRALRPHFKAHKTTALLDLQPDTPGICTQTAREALILARAGVADVFLTNEVMSSNAIEQLVAAARAADVTVLVDDPVHVSTLSGAAVDAGVELVIAIEVDVGMRRCGVDLATNALEALADAVIAAPGLRLRGIQGYEGHAAGRADAAERGAAVTASAGLLERAATRLAGAVDGELLVGGGSTGTIGEVCAAPTPWTEVQAGSYLLMDAAYGAHAGIAFEQALFIVTTVLHSRPGFVVVDAGLKAMAVDHGLPPPAEARMATRRVSDEHCAVEVLDGPPPAIGDRVALVPGHIDPTVNLHAELWLGSEHDEPHAVPIDARGW